jgi:hypothetical protein
MGAAESVQADTTETKAIMVLIMKDSYSVFSDLQTQFLKTVHWYRP